MIESFERATGRKPASRGVILFDFDGTVNKMKDGRAWNPELFTCAIAWKSSGYDTIFNTTSSPDSVDDTVRFRSQCAKIDRDFFALNEDEPEAELALQKTKTKDWDAIAVFDDEVMPRTGKTGILLDPNLPHVRAALERIAAEWEASGRTQILTFNTNDFSAPTMGAGPHVVPDPNRAVA